MHNGSALGALTNAQVLTSLKGYFFWCALVMFPGFVLVHVLASRIYAAGLVSLLEKGSVSLAELTALERAALERLGLPAVPARPERNLFVRVVAWTGTRLGRVTAGIGLVFVWFSFIAQIYISEFFNYHSGLGWINQPLVQLPWFRYLPASARNPWADVSTALLVLLLALLISSVARSFNALRRGSAAGRHTGLLRRGLGNS
jgi:hypothetical protein